MLHRFPPMLIPSAALTVLFTVLAVSSGCGPGAQSSGRKLAKVNGQLVQVTDEEEATLCKSQYCEPNQIYTIDFGSAPRRRPAKPRLPAEKVDYSKAILKVGDAWQVTKGSREVVVAIVDTGVDLEHPDLRKNLWTNWDEKYGLSGVDDDGNGYVDDVHGYDFFHGRPDGDDDNRHGTHCAGIIGAEENRVGTIGVSPNVRLMPLKFLGPTGSGDTYAAVQAIRYAIDNGAQVISNSWGGGGYSEFLNEVIQEALASDIAVVAAAGNSAANNDWNPSYPASYAGVISVGSTDSADRMSSFSNYGYRSVTVAAPGSDIYSSVLDAKWAYLSGTSMATPQVAGALALARAANPGATVGELRAALCETSARIHLDRVKCGRMDAGRFVARVSGASGEALVASGGAGD